MPHSGAALFCCMELAALVLRARVVCITHRPTDAETNCVSRAQRHAKKRELAHAPLPSPEFVLRCRYFFRQAETPTHTHSGSGREPTERRQCSCARACVYWLAGRCCILRSCKENVQIVRSFAPFLSLCICHPRRSCFCIHYACHCQS